MKLKSFIEQLELLRGSHGDDIEVLVPWYDEKRDVENTQGAQILIQTDADGVQYVEIS